MPLVGSCSAAISAVYHKPRVDHAATNFLLLWGALSGQAKRAIGHFNFTTFETSPPIEGELYPCQQHDKCVMATVWTIDKEIRQARCRCRNSNSSLKRTREWKKPCRHKKVTNNFFVNSIRKKEDRSVCDKLALWKFERAEAK